jgi:hypothetical protein
MRYRPGHSKPAVKAAITPEQAAELQQLYAELPKVAEAAVKALNIVVAAPTDVARQQHSEQAARVNEITDRIRAILG